MLNATIGYRNYNPSRVSVTNDPRVQEVMGAWGGGSYLKTVAKNLETARVAWIPQPERTRLGDIWARALHEVYFQRMPAADALKKASGEVDKVLKEAGIKVAGPHVTTKPRRAASAAGSSCPTCCWRRLWSFSPGCCIPSAWGCTTASPAIGCSIPIDSVSSGSTTTSICSEEPLFVRALEFTFGFTLVAVVVQVGLGLAVALFLHARIPGRSAMRALMLLPLMIPPVITALMWKIMMASTNAGILNYVLSFLGVDPINWFGSTQGAIVSVLIIDTWGNLPFVALILLGGLQALPTEPYEAARVDGAGPIAMLRYVTLPLLSPFIVLVRPLPDDGFAADLRRDLRDDVRGAERRDHQPADHGVPVFLPVVPNGQGHGPGHRAAAAGRHGQLRADAAVEPRAESTV